MAKSGLSLRQRATRVREIPPVVPDYSDGRPFNPITPYIDGFARVMITAIPVVHKESGAVGIAYEVDYFNCENPSAAIALYERGKEAVLRLVDENE